MQFSISATGNAAQLRQAIREHEDRYWHDFNPADRLLLHHLLGHQVATAEQHNRSFTLSASGFTTLQGSTSISVSLAPVSDQ